jgi:flavorubredoxin
MTIELYNDGHHACLMFPDLIDEQCAVDNCAVQSNQFLIVTDGHGALIDPGGNMTFNSLLMAMHKHFPARKLEYILASHADPDIVASLNKWLVQTDCKLLISKLWARFVPHFCSVGNTEDRIVAIPDEGMEIRLGNSKLLAIPAHFLHAEGNFHFYDPVSKILFTGDVGASMVPASQINRPVTNFDAHLEYMEPFHRRLMVSNKVCRYWTNMVRKLDVEAIVPQHGRYFQGKPMVKRFLDWFEQLDCGIDLLGPESYRIPRTA